MSEVGILAYGSLIEDSGKEIGPLIRHWKKDVETPFSVEFARSSTIRGGGPTLVPVKERGARVLGQILELDSSVSIDDAKDLLWRRETRKEGSGEHYKPPNNPECNHVVVKCIPNFHGIKEVLYTHIGKNIKIKMRTPEHLADLAICSARRGAAKDQRDGISYLISIKEQRIKTPLMNEYEAAILRKTGAVCLSKALQKIKEGEA